MEFSSQRLLIRDFTEGDFSLFCSVFTDGQVMRYTYKDCFCSPQDCRAYFDSALRNAGETESRKRYEFAVFTLSDGHFIGFADAEIYLRNAAGGVGEIGYLLLPDAWGQGYATEIARTLIGFCFTSLGLHRVEAHCNANNACSENVMKKAGMTWEGESRKVRFKEGRWDNEKSYAILKEEWLENSQTT
jgi:ribosomal-protein-alanine N-acetyltransferase